MLENAGKCLKNVKAAHLIIFTHNYVIPAKMTHFLKICIIYGVAYNFKMKNSTTLIFNKLCMVGKRGEYQKVF